MADSNINNTSSCLDPISTDQSSTTTDHQLAAAAEDDHAKDQSSTSTTGHQVAADVATAIAITNSADGDGIQADGNDCNRPSTAAAAAATGDHDDAKQISEIRKTMKSHTIVAALIATVTFAAAFTLPGGYVQSGSEYYQGMAVLSLLPPPNNIPNSTEVVVGTYDAMMMRRNRFVVFVWVDSIAMLLSLSAIVVYFLAAFPIKSKKPLRAALFYGYLLTMLALIAMVFAVIVGLLAVLPESGYEAFPFVIFLGFFLLGFGPTFFIVNMDRPTW